MTSYFSGFYPAETADGAKGSAAFTGATNIAILQLYKRSATTLGDSDKPNGVVTYTFATALSDLSNITNGWTNTIPSGTDPLYVVAATAASSDPTDTIAINEWATPVILVQNGTGGLNTATVFLFKRGNTSTLPAVPTQTVTYTFASGIALGSSSVGNTVSPYLDGWSQTAPDSAGNKYLFMITGTAISTGSSDSILTTEWSTVRIMAQDGAVGYTGYLTNESHTLPASPTGVVSAYTGASGDFKIFLDGIGDISSSFSLSTVSNPQTLTVAYTGSTYTISGGFDAGEDTAVITIRATGSGTYSGVILDKVFSLAKSKAGTDGSSSKLLAVSTSRQLISYSSTGVLNPVTQTTTLSANKQNTTATVNWTIQDSIGNTLTPATYLSATTGDSITMTAANFQAAISVNASEGVIIIGTLTDGITLSDRVTIMKVKAGADGTDGTDGTDGVDGVNSATVFLYQRATTAPAVPAVDSTYTFSTKILTGTLGSWTQTIPAGTNPIYVISATAVSNTATDIIPTTEWAVPSVLAQNGTNGSNGINAATVFLYQRATSAPAVPATDSTYTFSSGVLTGTLGSWTQTVPAGTNPIYVISATASSNAATDIIPTTEWAVPSVLAQNGTNGSNGLNNAIVYLYQRAASTPAAPGGTFTYTFSTTTLSGGTFGSWTQAIPATNGNPLWVIAATASSTTNTDSIPAAEFSAPVTLVQDGSGGVGATSALLTRESQSLFAYADGTVVSFASANGNLKIYSGNTEVTNSATTFTATASGCTGTINTADNVPVNGQAKGYYQITAMSADTATLTLSATYSGTTFTKIYTITKTRGGYEILGTLPLTNLFQGRTVFLTTDNKLYRYTGSAWVTSVPATDISGTLEDAQIAALAASKVTGTLTSAQIDSLAATKISGTLTSAQIESLASTKISGTLTNAQIDAIAASKITGSLVSSQITDAAITTAKFASGLEPVTTVTVVPATKSTSTIFNSTDGKLYRWNGTSYIATVPAADISGTIANTQIDTIAATKVTGTLTNAQIEAIAAAKITGQITSTQITDGAVSTDKLAANSITAAKIAADTITASQIAADAITANELAANAVTANKIAANTITAGQIAANTITSSQIAADTITSNEIAANAITVNELAANAVTAVKIAANTITSGQIAADTITAGNIAAGAITTSELSAGAVTAEKITVTSRGDSVILNPGFEEASAADSTLPARWTRNRVWGGSNTTAFRDTAEVLSGSTSLALIPGAGFSADSLADLVPVSPGEQWYLACKAKSSGTNAGSSPGFYFRVRGGASPSTIGIELYIGVENLTVSTSWTKYEGIVTIPSGMTWAAPILLNYQANTGAKISIDDVEFRKVVTSASIADGAITAVKIQASSITSAQIAADTITAGNIAANAITASEISAGAVIAGKIAADAITANEIAANAITSSEIAAGAITAGKIAAGSIVAADIAANTITAANIAANTITATQIASNAITADEINSGAITTAKLASTQISSMFATIGTLQSAPSGARVEISDSIIKVFDASNTLRVRLGVW